AGAEVPPSAHSRRRPARGLLPGPPTAVSMNLRDHITSETSALIERLVAASESAAEQVRLDAEQAIEQLRGHAEGIRSELEAEASRRAVLEAELEAEVARTG